VRTERCVCGGTIRAASLIASRQAVAVHNMTLPHLAWRMARGIYTPALLGPNDPRRRWPTAGDESCDVSGNTDGASTSDVEGIA